MTLNPATSVIDQIRLKLGDTSEPYILDDAVYQYLLDKNNQDVYRTSVEALEAIVASFAKMADEVVGDEEYRWGDVYTRYRDLLDDLKSNPVNAAAWLPFAGGISVSDSDANNANTDANKARIQQGSSISNRNSIWG